MNEEVGKRVLFDVKEVLDKAGIHFWLDYGTLLGAVRDQCFIPSDNDIDVAIRVQDVRRVREIKKEFRSKGFEVFYGEADVEVKRNGCYLGISAYTFTDDYAFIEVPKNYEYNWFGKLMWLSWHVLMVPNYCDIRTRDQHLIKKCFSILVTILVKLVPYCIRAFLVKHVDQLKHKYGAEYTEFRVPAKYFRTFTKLKFYEKKFSIPEHYENYLEQRYGKTWRTPITNKEWTREDRAKQQLGLVKP